MAVNFWKCILLIFIIHFNVIESSSQSLEDSLYGHLWAPAQSIEGAMLLSDIKGMQFMKDGSIAFPGIEDLDSNQVISYKIVDSVLFIDSGSSVSSFGKISVINDQFMLLNPVIEETGEVVSNMNIIFYSDQPTRLNLHPDVLKDLQAFSKWKVEAYGQSIDLVIGPGGKEYDHSSLVKEGNHYFLSMEKVKLKILSIYHDRMVVLGIGTEGYSELVLNK